MRTFILLLVISLLAYYIHYSRAYTCRIQHLHSSPNYHGQWAFLVTMLPGIMILTFLSFVKDSLILRLTLNKLPDSILSNSEFYGLLSKDTLIAIAYNADNNAILKVVLRDYENLNQIGTTITTIAAISTSLIGFIITWRRFTPAQKTRNYVEYVMKLFMILCAAFAIFTTISIILSLLIESIHFFKHVSITEFFLGLEWNPQVIGKPNQDKISKGFGIISLLTGTLLIASIAMTISIPTGLSTAIYTSEYATPRLRSVVKPFLEVLAGVPTVVYGFFAALIVAPSLRVIGTILGVSVSSESALAAGVVIGVMIIPFVSSLADDIISAVPQSLREGSLGLGATDSETIRSIILPAALPGIVGGILLAVSRALGETMIVVMAAGLSAKITVNPLETVTTVTAQIVALLVGDQEFDSPRTLAAFALGLTLFSITLILNAFALRVVRRYREEYE